ncbi:MAG: YraN family protein [Candidatus Omnitrophica bacterium]|nr:YraN family protein [Candidatus Omnitrophota bacterium]
MTFERLKTGKRGEHLARGFLEKQGYRIIERNYRTRCGEIDMIGMDKDCVSFIEVRTGNTERFAAPEYSINKRKQNQIAKSALWYIKKKRIEDQNCRFDVVCVEGVNSDSPKLRLIKNAFELDERYRY